MVFDEVLDIVCFIGGCKFFGWIVYGDGFDGFDFVVVYFVNLFWFCFNFMWFVDFYCFKVDEVWLLFGEVFGVEE